MQREEWMLNPPEASDLLSSQSMTYFAVLSHDVLMDRR
jgi:hypothetical protein